MYNPYTTISEDDVVTITDEGRGLPRDIHEVSGEPAVYALFEIDRAGAKGTYNQGGYSEAAGMHGAGASIAKSCAEYFMITSTHEGTIDSNGNRDFDGTYTIIYMEGERAKEIEVIAPVTLHPNPMLANAGICNTGTTITYKYDKNVFSLTRDGVDTTYPYLNKVIHERIQSALIGTKKGSVRVLYKFKNFDTIVITPDDMSPEKYLDVNPEDTFIPIELNEMSGGKENSRFSAKVYIKYTTKDSYSKINSTVIVNRLKTTSSTIHGNVFSSLENFVITEAIAINGHNSIINEELIAKYASVSAKTIRGLSSLVILTLPHPEFDGQTKSKLKSKGFVGRFNSALSNQLNGFMVQSLIQELAGILAKAIKREMVYEEEERKALEVQAKKEAIALRDAQAVNNLKDIINNPTKSQQLKLNFKNNSSFGGVYKNGKHPISDCSLVIVEGASASASLQVDDLEIEIFGLGGKPLNIVSSNAFYEGVPYVDIYNPSSTDMLIFLLWQNYKNILILTDADADGQHIQVLLLALIQKYAPSYLISGKVNIIKTPHAKIKNTTKSDITVKFEGEDKVFKANKKVDNFTMSSAETALVKTVDGLEIQELYTGLADSITGTNNLTLQTLITSDEYLYTIEIDQDNVNKSFSPLIEILKEESVLKRQVISNKQTLFTKKVYRNSTIRKIKVKENDISKIKYSLTPEYEQSNVDFIRSIIGGINYNNSTELCDTFISSTLLDLKINEESVKAKLDDNRDVIETGVDDGNKETISFDKHFTAKNLFIDSNNNLVDDNGDIIGSYEEGHLYDSNRNLLDINGKIIGYNYNGFLFDSNSNLIDADRNIIGFFRNGHMYDANSNLIDFYGNIIGFNYSGYLFDINNNLIDADLNIIGYNHDNKLFDPHGNLIDINGNIIGFNSNGILFNKEGMPIDLDGNIIDLNIQSPPAIPINKEVKKEGISFDINNKDHTDK